MTLVSCSHETPSRKAASDSGSGHGNRPTFESISLKGRLSCIDSVEDLGEIQIVRGQLTLNAPELTKKYSKSINKSLTATSVAPCKETFAQLKEQGIDSGDVVGSVEYQEGSHRNTYWNKDQTGFFCSQVAMESLIINFDSLVIKSKKSSVTSSLQFGASFSKVLSQTEGECN